MATAQRTSLGQSVVPSLEETSHLVVAARHHHVFQPALVGLVYTIFGGVHSGIKAFESLGVDIFIRESAACGQRYPTGS